MRWDLFDASNHFARAQDLPNSWNTSLARAAKGLENHGFIHIARRRLQSFEECIRYYPDKTLQNRTRAHQTRFLPKLRGCVDDQNGITSRYDVADNEKFYLKQLPRAAVEELGRRWSRLEESLRPVYGRATESADDLLGLINRGRYLFRRRDFEVGTSLKHALESVYRKKLLPSALAHELRTFYNDFFRATRRSLQLKSFVHSVAIVPNQRQCSLRPETMEYLYRCDEDYIKSMPGFKEIPGPRDPDFDVNWAHRDKLVFPPELEALFDQTVFQKFSFVSLSRT